VHLREELAARKAERDDAIQEVRRLIKGDAEVSLVCTCCLTIETPKLGMFPLANAFYIHDCS
jgi:hypothetical protein